MPYTNMVKENNNFIKINLQKININSSIKKLINCNAIQCYIGSFTWKIVQKVVLIMI